MRVVHVAPTAFGTTGLFGGGERYPLELARALARSVDCELLTFGRQARDEREPGGLRVRVLRPPVWLRGHPAHPLSLRAIPPLTGHDVIHAHHLRSTPSRLAAVTAAIARKPAVVTDHGLQGSDWHGLLPRLFDRFLTVSSYSARLLGAPRERTHVIYGGADPLRYAPDPRTRRAGVLFVGRITPHKGIDRLIEALPQTTLLRIAGSEGHDPEPPESGYPQYLRQLAAGRNVEFLGPIADDDLPALYRSAAVFVLPSVHRTCYGRDVRVSELLGLVALEAMASGTPVIGSRIGGVPEIIEHGITGYLVEPGDIPELGERLMELLDDPARAAWMGYQARERVLERFTWDHCAERCLEGYAQLRDRR